MRKNYPRLNFVDDDLLFESLKTQSIEAGPLLDVVRVIFPGVCNLTAGGAEPQKVLRTIEGWQVERFRLISGVTAPSDGKLHEEFLRDLGAALVTSVFEWTRQCLESWEKCQAGNKLYPVVLSVAMILTGLGIYRSLCLPQDVAELLSPV